MALKLQPITLKQASAFITEKHRHHKPPQGWKFGVGVSNEEGELVGVATVGRPVARGNDDGYTLEVTRLCTDGSKNACSMLYSAAWRAGKALGYTRVITYILDSESGTSLLASGYKEIGHVKGRSWSCKSRPRMDKHPTVDKKMFCIGNCKNRDEITEG